MWSRAFICRPRSSAALVAAQSPSHRCFRECLRALCSRPLYPPLSSRSLSRKQVFQRLTFSSAIVACHFFFLSLRMRLAFSAARGLPFRVASVLFRSETRTGETPAGQPRGREGRGARPSDTPRTQHARNTSENWSVGTFGADCTGWLHCSSAPVGRPSSPLLSVRPGFASP